MVLTGIPPPLKWYLPVDGREQAAGRQHEGAPGQDGATVVHPVQVAARHVCHADGAC